MILSSLKYILEDQTEVAEHPISLLTTGDRNKWAASREHLLKIGNKEALEEIDSALFAISLDTVVVEKPKDIVRWFLHSDGKNRYLTTAKPWGKDCKNLKNTPICRWFDKSFTLVTTANGFAGLNFEHSWGDGVAVLRYLTDVFNDSAKQPQITSEMQTETIKLSEPPKRLSTCYIFWWRKVFYKCCFTICLPTDIVLDDKIKTDIANAKKSFDDICSSLEVRDVICNLGRDQCKEFKVSPDAVMQLIFQLANYNLNKRNAPTYESCSTAAFKHGRTETVRPCTLETTVY